MRKAQQKFFIPPKDILGCGREESRCWFFQQFKHLYCPLTFGQLLEIFLAFFQFFKNIWKCLILLLFVYQLWVVPFCPAVYLKGFWCKKRSVQWEAIFFNTKNTKQNVQTHIHTNINTHIDTQTHKTHEHKEKVLVTNLSVYVHLSVRTDPLNTHTHT